VVMSSLTEFTLRETPWHSTSNLFYWPLFEVLAGLSVHANAQACVEISHIKINKLSKSYLMICSASVEAWLFWHIPSPSTVLTSVALAEPVNKLH